MLRIATASTVLLLLLAANALAFPTWGVDFARVCSEMLTQLEVTVWNNDFDNPTLPTGFTIIRTTTAPGLADPLQLTATPIPMPADGEQTTVLLDDPDLPANAIGYYQVWAHAPDGDEVLFSEAASSCVDEPYLMRALLVTAEETDPCEDIGLLECGQVQLSDPSMLEFVGTGELVDIYGWPVWLHGVASCGISVLRIEPLGAGATCEGVVAVQSESWSSVKSLYR